MKVGIACNAQMDFWEDYCTALSLEVVKSKKDKEELIQLGANFPVQNLCSSAKESIGRTIDLKESIDAVIVQVPKSNYVETCASAKYLPHLIREHLDVKCYSPFINYSDENQRQETLYELAVSMGFDKNSAEKASKTKPSTKRLSRTLDAPYYPGRHNIMIIGNKSLLDRIHIEGKTMKDYISDDLEIGMTTPSKMNINLKPKKLTRYMRTDLIEASIKKAKDENAVTGVLLLMDSYCTSKCWDFPLLESRIEKQYSVPCQIIQSAGNDAEHVRLRLDTFSEVMKSLM